jgi:hypothetical protein
MRRAFLMVGFNNWGKTTLIYDLFNRKRFALGEGYQLNPCLGQHFTVESLSNDDLRGQRYITKIEQRVQGAPSNAADLVGVLCPSREPENDACDILNSKAFAPFKEIHLLLMHRKWDLHAELRLSDVETYFKCCGNKRLRLHTIDEGVIGSDKDRGQRRCSQAHDIIAKVL